MTDFRSDTVTRPSDAMRAAMAAAVVGDDVLDGDPTVRRLEERAATWLGKQGALFVPSGTMANQIAAGAWTRPGDEVIVEESAHVLHHEGGGLAASHGLRVATLPSERGAMDSAAVQARIGADTTLVFVEQTHLESGGRVVPLENLRAVHAVARERGVHVHLDGARLPNAVAASGVAASAWAACADSVSVCLSKGLGAPVGSLIAGDREFLERARAVRQRLGGGMRQSGVIAAAGLVALEQNLDRLEEDHRLAKDLAERLHALPGLSCPPAEVETNIVFVAVDHPELDAEALGQRLAERGVRIMPWTARCLRCVTHLDVGLADVEHLEAELRAILLA
ncbi:MAG: GntG family PLP-dependent aldolase [Planctomycetota bacterium]|nr:GntG family PLP-dependent aldolase [Planctomycetota bacterium]